MLLASVAQLGCEREPSACPLCPDATTSDVGPTPDAGETDASGLDALAPSDAPPVPRDGALPFPTFASLVPPSGGRVLFVGNSYTFYSDLPGVHVALLAGAGLMPGRTESVTAGGWRLTQHAMDAATDGTPIATFLRTGTPDERTWDVVVLQEQSQIPGFPDGNAERAASEEGASELAALADATGAATVLYVTWGRERGDDTNPGLFPDFETMEAALENGYRAIAARLEGEGRTVRLAPVGPAFALVHASVTLAGGDPTTEGSAFDALYDADGSHPSPLGTYLAACVILATITGRDPESLADAPSLGLAPADAAAMRAVAHDVLSSPTWTPPS